MRIDDEILDRIRRADPLDAEEAEIWRRSHELGASQLLGSISVASSVASSASGRGRSRRTRRRVAIAAVLASAGLATAAAAAGVLGRPAPDRVRLHLAALDEGLPADLRLNPDVAHARAVAATAGGALYAADLQDGGSCMEIVSDGDRPRGATCTTAAELGERPVEVMAPIASSAEDILLVGGRVNADQVRHVVIRYADGQRLAAAEGIDRYWLVEVPASEHASALRDGLVVTGLAADNHEVSTVAVDGLLDDDPLGTRLDQLQPIFVSTISAGDLTQVLGIEGSVHAVGAVRLSLRYPDGTTTTVPLGSDGTYRYMLPAERQDDFAKASGLLVARDATGNVVASVPVSSVAGGRRHG